MPAVIVERRGLETLDEQSADDLVGEGLRAAAGVMDDEPFPRAEQLGPDDRRVKDVVAGAAAGVADDKGVAFREIGEFRTRRASMQARIAKRRAGGSARAPLSPKDTA